jgi:hypothetical protein
MPLYRIIPMISRHVHRHLLGPRDDSARADTRQMWPCGDFLLLPNVDRLAIN